MADLILWGLDGTNLLGVPKPQPDNPPAHSQGEAVTITELETLDIAANGDFAFFEAGFTGTAMASFSVNTASTTGVLSVREKSIGRGMVDTTSQLLDGVQVSTGQLKQPTWPITKGVTYALRFSVACNVTVKVIGIPGIVADPPSGVTVTGSNVQGVHGQPAPAQLLCVAYIDINGNVQSFSGGQFGAYDGDTGFTIAQVVTNYALGYNGTTWDRRRVASVFKPVAVSALGANAIWTPASGKKFRLMGFLLSFSGTTNAKFQDDTTDISGLLYGVANTQVPSTDMGNGILSAAANNVLNLNLSAAVAVGGVVWGVEE